MAYCQRPCIGERAEMTECCYAGVYQCSFSTYIIACTHTSKFLLSFSILRYHCVKPLGRALLCCCGKWSHTFCLLFCAPNGLAIVTHLGDVPSSFPVHFCDVSNSFLTKTGKLPVMIGTLLYVFGSCERHSELTEEMCIPLRPIPKENTLLHWCFY